MGDYHEAINWTDEQIYDRLAELVELKTIPSNEERASRLDHEEKCLSFEIAQRTGAVLLPHLVETGE